MQTLTRSSPLLYCAVDDEKERESSRSPSINQSRAHALENPVP